MPFLDDMDIANKAVQILGGEAIITPGEDSVRCTELTFAYDKLRRPELRRNTWTFATRKTVLRALGPGTMLLQAPIFNLGQVYQPGSIVKDTNNLYWFSTQEQNVGNSPGGNNDAWDMYFGPLTVAAYNSGTAYYAGELVYVPGTGAGTGPTFAGGYQIFMSLVNGNTDAPNTATAWSATQTYYGGQMVSYLGNIYVSTNEINLNITPFDGSQWPVWSSTTSYTTSQQVTGSDGFLYVAATNNANHNPVGDNGTYWTAQNKANAWTKVASSLAADIQWVLISGATMKNLLLTYPVGSGPSTDGYTKNAFRLPAGYLKTAPQDPKAGSVSILGAPTGRMITDWTFENDFLVSANPGPIVFRFVADVTKVSKMDDMFCIGLAARMAWETCEKITQSTAKQTVAIQAYTKVMGEARTANAVESGFDEPPEDDYITCRL